MNNAGIAENIYQVALDEITQCIDVRDQKEIATYAVNDLIHRFGIGKDISDGYHTFNELYKHRIHLFIALCKSFLRDECWYEKVENYIIKSKKHFDGSEFQGWFIIQLETSEGQISYHLPNEYWDRCDFIETVKKANEFDLHTSDDVLERLLLI